MNRIIVCQALYDWREETEAISGLALHEVFREAVGQPSPSGYVAFNLATAQFPAKEKFVAWLAARPDPTEYLPQPRHVTQ